MTVPSPDAHDSSGSEPIAFAEVLKELEGPAGLSGETARRAFDAVLSGSWTQSQIAGLLVGLRMRPDDPTVLAAAVQSMRKAMVRVPHDFPLVVDTCGTGGDGHGTLNLSTASAIIVAAAGHIVAKHGNRAVSSRAGSADVLAALGIPLDLTPLQSTAVLKDVGISFLLAPTHHPAMRFAMPVRRELGVRTIFNCLGPMANPAMATHQLVGAFSQEIRPLLAKTLGLVGTARVWVVCGLDGLDEISPFVPTRVTEVCQGVTREFEVCPEDFGLSPSPAGAIAGGDAEQNAKQLADILRGVTHPATDAVLLNAAAALVVAEDIPFKDAKEKAHAVLLNGLASRKLEDWQRAAQRQKSQ